jgi:hypothetical protein
MFTPNHWSYEWLGNSLCDLVARCVLELSVESKHRYTTYTEESEQDNPEVIVMVIVDERKCCFHMAITSTNTDIENAREVCAQAVLYKSAEDDPDLYYSVYDSRTQKVFFCLCAPAKQEFEDVSCYSMQGEADKVSEWLKTYIVSNTEALRRWKGIT